MGAGPIQISEILAYCRLCGFSEPIVCHDILRMVQAMDSEWLAIEGAKKR